LSARFVPRDTAKNPKHEARNPKQIPKPQKEKYGWEKISGRKIEQVKSNDYSRMLAFLRCKTG